MTSKTTTKTTNPKTSSPRTSSPKTEPDAEGRVAYKIHMTTAASQLPSRKTDAQRAAKLIYGSVIKKHGNPCAVSDLKNSNRR
jgi:hypothetical protein